MFLWVLYIHLVTGVCIQKLTDEHAIDKKFSLQRPTASFNNAEREVQHRMVEHAAEVVAEKERDALIDR